MATVVVEARNEASEIIADVATRHELAAHKVLTRGNVSIFDIEGDPMFLSFSIPAMERIEGVIRVYERREKPREERDFYS
ncbi:MAG: hypothetical protein AAB846_01880 [Patescibacteria group bacterium]